MTALAEWRARPSYYRRNGTPIWYGTSDKAHHRALMEWTRMLEGDRKVNDTTLPNGIRVSTVWLGLDHNFGFDGPPLIFESMAFSASVNVHKAREGSVFVRDFAYHEELDCERYSTEAEAAVGHVMMCLRWYPDVMHMLPEVAHGFKEAPKA